MFLESSAATDLEPGLALAPAMAAVNPEQFDLARFQAPHCDRQQGVAVLRFTLREGAGWCRLAVHRSVAAGGNLAADFAAEWQRRVDPAAPVPALRTLPAGNGWTLAAGAAPVALDTCSHGMALLCTWGGHGRRLSVVAVYDHPRWQAAVDAFVASVQLLPPPSRSLAGTRWRRHAAIDGAPTCWHLALAARGRYALSRETSLPGTPGGWLERLEESGQWRQAGTVLVLEPASSELLTRERVPGRRPALQVRALPPEATAYRLQTPYDPAAAAWQLLLAPVSGRPTRRDGPFTADADVPVATYRLLPDR